MKIIVLMKQVPDTWGERTLDSVTGVLQRQSSEPVIDEINERALETALRYKDGHDADVVVLAMGPPAVGTMLKKTLGLGADSAIHVCDEALAGADLATTATVLTAAITRAGFDLVIAGNESTDGRGGVLPAMIAEGLAVPHLTSLNTVTLSTGQIRGERATEYGVMAIHADLPAVISVTETAPDARFASFKGIMKAKKKTVDVWALSDLQLPTPTTARGHTVILSTTVRAARTGGTKVVDTGNAGIELAEFLTAAHLL